MLEYVLWFVSLVTLFVGVYWYSILSLEKQRIRAARKPSELPPVSIIVPAWNEEAGIGKTLDSLLKLKYPKDRLEIIVVNDCSTDGTRRIAESYRKKGVIVVSNKQNIGAAATLNKGVRLAKGELVGRVDADSSVDSDSLRSMIHHFEDEKTAAVITNLKADRPKKFLERLQRLEYIYAAFYRRLMASINTLYITPGVLSLYRKSVLKKVGGFDEKSITEDFEMAMRLHYHGYRLASELSAVTYTTVPPTPKDLWSQRIRWGRGFVETTLKYKEMLFNPKYGMIGAFQIPLNIASPFLLIIASAIIVWGVINRLYTAVTKLWVTGGLGAMNMPTLKAVVLGLNIKVLLPVIMISGLGIYMLVKAHKLTATSLKNPFEFLMFVTVYPWFMAAYWLWSAWLELRGVEKKW